MAVDSLAGLNGSGHYDQSVVRQLPLFGGVSPASDIVFYLGGVADEMPAWGTDVRYRDLKLRQFYKTESMLSGTVFGTTSRYSSFKYVLTGPERQVNIMQRILHNSEHGYGWLKLMVKVIKDYLTQDNGGWIEVIRVDNKPGSPVIQLNHLDSSRVQRTGNWEEPAIYTDIYGGLHKLMWYQVLDVAEYPDPDERYRGYQECAVSRLLMDAQKARDISIYEREKFSGRNPTSVHLIGGIPQQRIDNIIGLEQNRATNMGNHRYMVPPMIAALDQASRVSHEEIVLRGQPDGWDKAEGFHEYVILLALAFGLDPQDIAPIQGRGGLSGSGSQSQTLAPKGRGKGPALFMSTIEQIMNFHGVMPASVSFHYQEQDDAENEARTNLQWRRAQMYKLYATPTKMPGSGGFSAGTPGSATANGAAATEGEPILPVKIIRQMMRDNGDLRPEYLDALGEADLTPKTDLRTDDKPTTGL